MQSFGKLHITKDCTNFSGNPGSSTCEIKSSNLPEIPKGSLIFYDQPTGGPLAGAAGFLDSNIFIYVRPGQWVVGRCTLDNSNGLGLCTLSDGVGPLAGFRARVSVSPLGGPLFAWDGTFDFKLARDE